MRDASFDADALRVLLHVLAVSVWLGGQIVVGGIVPVLRRTHPEALNTVANAFGRVAWPAFAIAVFTGVWNMLAVDSDETTSGWDAALGIKMVVVVVAGAGAWVHQTTDRAAVRGVGAGVALLASLAAAVLGVMLSA